jgi:iron complex transport system substrate-binding protein
VPGLGALAGAVAVAAALATSAASTMAQAQRVLSLDQCADQYVLALTPRTEIVGLSTRARNPDAFLAAVAAGLPRRRADTESALAARPTVVVRYWGGDPGLLADLARRGARIVTIADATNFDGVRRNVRDVAAALGNPGGGRTLIADMDRKLAASRGAWRGRGAVYLTSGGATAGSGTLIDAMMQAAGLTNLTRGTGYRELSLEALQIVPPSAIVEGYFDAAGQAQTHWGPGRHGALQKLAAGRALVSLPATLLGCPAWFAADATSMIAAAAPKDDGRRRTCAPGANAGDARCA